MSFTEYLKYLLLLIFRPRSLKTMEWRMLKLTNQARKQENLPKLIMQDDLRKVARKHSLDMAKKDYFSHTNLQSHSPQDRLKLKRITEVTSGENLALVRGYKNPTQHAHIGLMNSPGHRANILNPSFNCVGIGIIQSSDKTYYSTQNFAKREIIFTKRIPRKTTLKKGLKIKGYTLKPFKNIFAEIQHTQKKPILKPIPITKKKFKAQINFPSRNIYRVKFFTPTKNPHQFHLVNHFEIKVKKGWW